MKRNVGNMDRILRGAAGAALLSCAVVAQLPLVVAGGLGATGGYLIFTAFAGTCLGYRLMGRSTCPVEAGR